MKHMIGFLLLATSMNAFADGLCRARQGQDNMDALCRIQTKGSYCRMNPACEWISLNPVGVCVAVQGRENMDALCRLQTRIDYCKMNPACKFIEIDN